MSVYTTVLGILCMETKRSLMRLSQSGGQSGRSILRILAEGAFEGREGNGHGEGYGQ